MPEENSQEIVQLITQIPVGYSEVMFEGNRYSLTCIPYNSNRSLKVFAQELGGNDFISFNYYTLESGPFLRPCEMLQSKVLNFLRGWKPV